ncbi:MAG TPA: recombinase family protein [Streptosporangiaceae bacterium]|nr:recombinase family protein [Streptosporangiaceae bacterium]
MRLLLAARLSQDQAGQTGLDTQDTDARAWAERNGHEVIATAADKISGRTSPRDRPNLGPWLTEPHLIIQFDGIVVSKLDRLSRGRDWGIREWAEKHGKKIIVVSPELSWPPEKGDSTTPLIWDNLVNIASAEWENTSMRYTRMQAHLRDMKSFVGRPPFGFQIIGEAKAKSLAPDPVQAAAITEVVAMYLAGRSLRELCRYLDAQGIPTRRGGAWVPKTLSDVLRNPALAGRRVDGKGRTVLRIPPILDADTWRKLQAELDRKATKKGAVRAGTPLLAGVAVCRKCSGPMYKLRAQNTRKDGSKQYNTYYRCWGTSTAPSTCRNMYPLEDLDTWVEARMARVTFPRYEIVITPGHGHEDEIYEVERDLRELDLDAPNYDERHSALRARRAHLRALPSEADTVEYRKTGDTIGRYWKTLKTKADKRAFLLKLGVKVYVRRGETRDSDHIFLEFGDGLAQGQELAPEMDDDINPAAS